MQDASYSHYSTNHELVGGIAANFLAGDESRESNNAVHSAPAFTMTTLGDPSTSLTCSTHVASIRYPEYQLTGVPSFEDGANLVSEMRVASLLVPGAYPGVNRFLNDPRLVLKETFIHDIPHMVLVSRTPDLPQPINTLYYHPATRSLFNPNDLLVDTLVEVSSNEVAGQSLLSATNDSAAVTNQLVADALGLHIVRVLRPSKPMAWLLFVAAFIDKEQNEE